MGVEQSNLKDAQLKKFGNFYEIIDYIATNYILTMDFRMMTKLADKEHCDKLVVLSSDIIERYFTDMEVVYMEQRIKEGVEVNDMTKDKIIFLNKDNLTSMDIENDRMKSIKKKRVCIGIAKFYVKIAHIFAAIMTTVNPITQGDKQNTNNVCDNRIRILKSYIKDEKPMRGGVPMNDQFQRDNVNQYEQNLYRENLNVQKPYNPTGEKLYEQNLNVQKLYDQYEQNLNREKPYDQINEQFVKNNAFNKQYENYKQEDLYKQANYKQPTMCDITKTNLKEEPGITEFMNLYWDKYDYSTGQFTGMTPETRKKYERDLRTFYKAFTGNDEMPKEVQEFQHIKLRDYQKSCSSEKTGENMKKGTPISKSDKLYEEYANNLKKMIQRATAKQTQLLDVVNSLFKYIVDPYTKEMKVRVSPDLTEESLQKLVEKTRNIIMDLYVNCEKDYVNGVRLYETIVEMRILETTQNQIENLELELKQSYG